MSASCVEPCVAKETPTAVPPRFLERVVFRCGDTDVRVGDVLDEAWLRGDLGGAWREQQDGQAFEVMASGLGLESDGDELQAGSEAFRYERDLLTAEETEGWLAARGLDENEFVAHLLVRYWRAHPPGRLVTGREEYAATRAERRERLGREAMFNGAFETWAAELSWRWAAVVVDGVESDPAAVARERDMILSRHGWEPGEMERLVRRLGRDEAWLARVLAREAAFRRSSARRLTSAVLARALESRRIPLTRVSLETLVAPSLDAGREAVVCVRQGEVTMGDLAAECGFEFGVREVLLGECSDEQQRLLLAALPGEVLEPVPIAGGFAVTRLVDKVEPDPQRSETRARVEREWLKVEFRRPHPAPGRPGGRLLRSDLGSGAGGEDRE